MYRWELDGPAQQQFTDLNPAVRASLAAFMDAVSLTTGIRTEEARALRWDHGDPDGDPDARPPVISAP